ncbi:MAG: nucleoside deaminase [Cyanobacteria bacterium P01_H01_bin.74]
MNPPSQMLNSHYATWMQYAIAEAKKALPTDVPVGALVIQNNAPIGWGYNTREKDNNPLGHAELNALAVAGTALKNWRLNDCTLIVTLEPCPMCAAAIQQARIKTIIFGAYDPILGACGSKTQTFHDNSTVLGGIMESECKTLLDAFFKTLRS